MSAPAVGKLSDLARELEACLECSSCRFVLREPFLSTECMHIACKQCFINMVCPVCQRENRETDLVPEGRMSEVLNICRQIRQALEVPEQTGHIGGGPLCPNRQDNVSNRKNTNVPAKDHVNSFMVDCEQSGLQSSNISMTKADPKRPNASSVNSKLNKKNRLGETLLHVACKKGILKRVTELLAQGATPNTQDNAGWSPLHEVAQTGNVEIARLLIENGAKVDVASECKTLPLHDAVQAGHPAVISLLLEYGANPQQPNGEGQSALDLASYSDAIRGVLVDFMAKPKFATPPVVTPPAADPLPPLSGPPVLMSSSLKGPGVQDFASCATLIGAEVTSKFHKRVTHLVVGTDDTGNSQRTLKFLQCVAAGCWIVSTDWASRCLAAGRRVDETPFEVRGCRQFPGNGAPRNARENRRKGSPGLFTGFSIYFAPGGGQLVPSMEELATMCELAGAAVLKREPRAQAGGRVNNPYLKPGSLLEAHSSFAIGTQTAVIEAGVLWLTRDWIIDSISQFQLNDILL